jgi:CheY-like chemotaxis protein
VIARGRADVLLVDDDPDVRRSLGRALQTAGYGVQRATHGVDALEKIDVHEFAVVVCDLMMPVMDGIRLYEVLRTNHPHAVERLLFITGWAHDRRIQQFLQGTDRPTLLKPFEMADFLEAVEKVAQGEEVALESGATAEPGTRTTPVSYSPAEIARIHEMIVTPGIAVVCPRCGDALAMTAPHTAEPAVTELRCGRCQRVMIVRDYEGER